jgi:cell division protein FtsI/penicillin-binding protein 2
LAATPDLSAHVVGHVGQPTAEQLTKLGDLYLPGDLVGLSGIETAAEPQLRGTPSGQITVIDSGGATVAVAKTFTGTPGQPVATTLDLPTQLAAEKALSGVTQPAAFVAVQPSTGEILAVVSRPLNAFDRALDGKYPPGSTFKVVTSAALLASGVTPDRQTTCPSSVTVDGKAFKNFEGETSSSLPFHRAFAISCNTAFVQLASQLSPSELEAAAKEFGFGATITIGVPAIGGSYPAPADAAEKVSSAIGQGRVTASPLQMATVAAAVDAGVWHAPHLTGPPPPDPGLPALSADVDQNLRTLMAEVVTSGTGTAAAPGGGTRVSGKTGTAEFGTASPPMTHAWFIGYSGDLAFSVVVEGGGVGGRVAAPIAAKFFTALATPPPPSGNGT